MRTLITACTLAAITTLFSWQAYPRFMRAGAQVNDGPLFHDVAAGATANFVVRGAPDVHVLSYFVLPHGPLPKNSYALQLAFVAADGSVRLRHTANFTWSAGEPTTQLLDGTAVSQVRLLALRPPEDTALLQISSPDGRVLLRANRLAPTKASQAMVIERAGRPAAWFAQEELQGLRSQGFIPLPVLNEVPTIKLPPIRLTKIEAETIAAATPALMPVGPHQALVMNVIGPGTMKMTLAAGKDGPAFQVEHIGREASGTAPVVGGRAVLELPAGPSSVIVRPLANQASLLQLETQNLRALGRTDQVMEAAQRPGSAWRVGATTTLRFPIYGRKTHPYPVRLTAHAVDLSADKTMAWRFLDKDGKETLRGTLQLSEEYDPFNALMDQMPVDLGLVSRTFLTPPAGTTMLEISAASAVVEVDALLEKGAQAEPLPPFDVALGSMLRWQDAPVRSARWVMLRPLGLQSQQRQFFAELVRRPRIEPIAPLPQGPWVQVLPQGHVKKMPIVEEVQKDNPDLDPQTLIRTEHNARIVVPEDGKNARRVVVNCEIPGQLGGELTLLLNGQAATSAPILSGGVRLTASAPAGATQVRVDGSSRGHCLVAARKATGPLTVRRSVFLVSPNKGLKVKVRTRGEILRLHYALYTDAADANSDAAVAVAVDGGEPSRRAGSANASTISQAEQVLPLTTVTQPGLSLSGSPMQRVAVSAVQLGDDLSAGNHRVNLRVRTPGRYWARFWIEGKRQMPEAAESFIVADASDAVEVQP